MAELPSNSTTNNTNDNSSPNVSAPITFNTITPLNNSHNTFSKMSESSVIDIKNVMQETKPNAGVKRLQVPRACAQCRKSHAGCDLERPCKRCRQNGMDALCSDVPRKKRESKKRIVEGTGDDWELINAVTSPPLPMPKKEDDWEQYAGLFVSLIHA